MSGRSLVDDGSFGCPEEPHYRLPKTTFRERYALRSVNFDQERFSIIANDVIEIVKGLTLDEFATFVLDPVIISLTDDGATNAWLDGANKNDRLEAENDRLHKENEELKRQVRKQPTAEKPPAETPAQAPIGMAKKTSTAKKR
jgi:hypothetical protein